MKCLECGGPFALENQHRGGRQPKFCSTECREARKRNTHAAWVAANSDWYADQKKDYRARRKVENPEYFRLYYARHKDKRKQESRAWYRENTARATERQKRYVAAHPEQTRLTGRKSTNKRRSVTKRVFVESVDPRVVFQRDKGVCRICMKAVDRASRWEVDHVIPISKGGAHSYDNVQLAHRSCNRSKGAKLPTGQPTLFQIVHS